MNIYYSSQNSGEKLLKTYRGYKITYYPDGFGGYQVRAGGEVNFKVQSHSDRGIMKKYIADAIRKAETAIDIEINIISSKRDRERMEEQLFKEVVESEKRTQYPKEISSKEFVFPQAQP